MAPLGKYVVPYDIVLLIKVNANISETASAGAKCEITLTTRFFNNISVFPNANDH